MVPLCAFNRFILVELTSESRLFSSIMSNIHHPEEDDSDSIFVSPSEPTLSEKEKESIRDAMQVDTPPRKKVVPKKKKTESTTENSNPSKPKKKVVPPPTEESEEEEEAEEEPTPTPTPKKKSTKKKTEKERKILSVNSDYTDEDIMDVLEVPDGVDPSKMLERYRWLRDQFHQHEQDGIPLRIKDPAVKDVPFSIVGISPDLTKAIYKVSETEYTSIVAAARAVYALVEIEKKSLKKQKLWEITEAKVNIGSKKEPKFKWSPLANVIPVEYINPSRSKVNKVSEIQPAKKRISNNKPGKFTPQKRT